MLDPASRPAPLTRWRILLFATTTGAMVANLYYVQPLLALVANAFHHDITSAGYLVTFTQIGYALGLLLIVPLGDVLDRRRLLTGMLCLNIIGLLAAGASQSFGQFAAASLLVGCTSSAAMVIVPYVAAIASDQTRGRVIGQVMTGLLLGILLARTVSGFVADWFGWRAMFFIAAVVVGTLLLALRAVMQRAAAAERLRYADLMTSLVRLVRTEPALRRRALYGLLGFASFSVMWTGLTFLLSGPPYHYAEARIGLFGLIGAAGAMSANFAGRMADRGLAEQMTGVFVGMLVVSWVLLAAGENSLAAVVGGVFVLDAAGQGLHVTSQAIIYRLNPRARARITAVYMTAAFIGAGLGSAVASASFAAEGWRGLCIAGGAMPVVLLGVWCAGAIRRSRASG